jgi:uncharacterized protein (DUF433 family)
MGEPKRYVRKDEHGVLRIGKTRVMLESVIASFEKGHSAETIQQQYPALTLEEVYGAIAHYLSDPEEIKTYLKDQEKVWSEWEARISKQESPVIQRLRALRAADISKKS